MVNLNDTQLIHNKLIKESNQHNHFLSSNHSVKEMMSLKSQDSHDIHVQVCFCLAKCLLIFGNEINFSVW